MILGEGCSQDIPKRSIKRFTTFKGSLRVCLVNTDTNHFVREGVQRRRQTNINNYINTLKGKEKTQAQLLAPTFTGWSDELTDVLANLETKQKGINW